MSKKETKFVDPPTCESCPYWDPTIDDVDEDDKPAEYKPCVIAHQAAWRGEDEGGNVVLIFPSTYVGDTCSKHPEYDKWVEQECQSWRGKKLLNKAKQSQGKDIPEDEDEE